MMFISCKKEGILPSVKTFGIWNIEARCAIMGGRVFSFGGNPINARGVCWSKSTGPTINDNHFIQKGDTGSFSVHICTLLPGTLYYVRAYATNETGTQYGNEVTFSTTNTTVPEVSTDTMRFINSTSAISGGSIFNTGGEIITFKGVCWSTTINPTIEDPHTIDGSGEEQFLSRIENLMSNTSYFLRAYATNKNGTGYGNNVIFKTLSDSDAIIFYPIIFNPNLTYGTVTDADFNVYKTIKIGNQTWMAENLKTILYRNYAQIGNGNGVDTTFWSVNPEGAYCWYDSDTSNIRNYGALYNWNAVNTGLLCPTGWHVPSLTELTTMISYIGVEDIAGGKLKEVGTTHWKAPNTGADNESGFTAMPGGYRPAGACSSIRTKGFWWSSSESSSNNASMMLIRNDNGSVSISAASKSAGMSVRCIKD